MSNIPMYQKIKKIKDKKWEKFLIDKGGREVNPTWRKKLEKSKKFFKNGKKELLKEAKRENK